MWRERSVMRSKTECFLMHSSVGTTNFSCNFLWLINVKHFFRYFHNHSSHETFVSPLACWQWFFKTLFSDLLSDACIWQPTECGSGAGKEKRRLILGAVPLNIFISKSMTDSSLSENFPGVFRERCITSGDYRLLILYCNQICYFLPEIVHV